MVRVEFCGLNSIRLVVWFIVRCLVGRCSVWVGLWERWVSRVGRLSRLFCISVIVSGSSSLVLLMFGLVVVNGVFLVFVLWGWWWLVMVCIMLFFIVLCRVLWLVLVCSGGCMW